jgi:hypothetical protein
MRPETAYHGNACIFRRPGGGPIGSQAWVPAVRAAAAVHRVAVLIGYDDDPSQSSGKGLAARDVIAEALGLCDCMHTEGGVGLRKAKCIKPVDAGYHSDSMD